MGKRTKLSSNPVESARKANRAKELKKNKEARLKSKEFSLVKKDTRSLELDIRNCHDPSRKDELNKELSRIREAKDKYLLEHPEHRKFIYPHSNENSDRQQKQQQQQQQPRSNTQGSLFGPDGKPYHPERSVYYDPVFNPWGNPPPGMPYAENPPHLWASTSQVGEEDSDEDSDDDDIVMPTGPPPPTANDGKESSSISDDDSSSDDDIMMPAGPPPASHTPAPSDLPPPGGYTGPPPSIPNGFRPRPPAAGIQYPHARPPHQQFPPHHQQYPPPPPHQYHHPRPPPRPSLQPRPPPNAPKGPSSSSKPKPATITAAPQPASAATITAAPQPASASAGRATISSAPQLRNLQKEAVTFLPPSIRKQKALAKGKAKIAGLGARGVVANPEVEGDEPDEDDGQIQESTTVPPPQSQNSPTPPPAASASSEPIAVSAPSIALPPVTAAVSVPSPIASRSKASLVSYYDDDDDSDGSDDAEEQQQASPPPPPTKSAGRVNLVEALKMNLPPPREQGQSNGKNQTSGGGGEYQNYLDSLGDLL
ncbi:unnamed protein product [Sympodiomycopsis kandeliae]